MWYYSSRPIEVDVKFDTKHEGCGGNIIVRYAFGSGKNISLDEKLIRCPKCKKVLSVRMKLEAIEVT